MQAPKTTLHYAPNGNLANGSYDTAGDPGSVGFNLADVQTKAEADSLPNGVQALLDVTEGGSVASAESLIAATANDPKVWGYYVADEPYDSDLPNVKAVDDYISQYAPGKISFFVAVNYGDYANPDYHAIPANTDADLLGLDPYPVRPAAYGGVQYSYIPNAVHAAEAAGWQQSQIVPVYQAWGGGQGDYAEWSVPTPQQEDQILATWANVVPNPKFDYAYSWSVQSPGESSLVNTPSLQAVFQQLFDQDANGTSPPPPATISTPSGPSTTVAIVGNTATVTTDGATTQDTVSSGVTIDSNGTDKISISSTSTVNVTVNGSANRLTVTDAGTGNLTFNAGSGNLTLTGGHGTNAIDLGSCAGGNIFFDGNMSVTGGTGPFNWPRHHRAEWLRHQSQHGHRQQHQFRRQHHPGTVGQHTHHTHWRCLHLGQLDRAQVNRQSSLSGRLRQATA